MKDKAYRLSIIIPAYNVENYIGDTLTACLSQDIPYEDYEIICINDGSTDNTANKIEEYTEKHSNIKLHNFNNSGVSSTRNKGIELAKGNYIWFVDSDDLIAENCLKTLLEAAEEKNADKLLFGMKHFDKEIPSTKNHGVFEFCNENSKLFDFMFTHGAGGVCRGIYRTEFLKENDIRFNEDIAYSEDVLFDFRVLINANRCVKTEDVYYFYRQHEGSAMHLNNFDKSAKSMYLLAKEYRKIAKSDIPEGWQKIAFIKSYFAVKALLFSLVQKGDIKTAKDYILTLKQGGLYPYPFLNILFNNKTLKEVVINWVSFLFPLKWYVFLCVKVSSLIKK